MVKHLGVGAPKNTTYLQEIKAMAMVAGKDVLPEVRLPRKRLANAPRKPYRRLEAPIRAAVVRVLKKRGFVVKRIENSICGDSGSDIPDLWVFAPHYKRAGWVEVKSLDGVQSEGQKNFEQYCFITGINYIIIRSEEEAVNLWKKIQ